LVTISQVEADNICLKQVVLEVCVGARVHEMHSEVNCDFLSKSVVRELEPLTEEAAAYLGLSLEKPRVVS
jgi:hypothetical protein